MLIKQGDERPKVSKRVSKMMIAMKRLSQNRHGTFEYRWAVPEELRGSIGRREVRVSLRTKDHAEAIRLLPLKRSEIEAKYRGALPVEGVTISTSEARTLANRWLLSVLGKDEERRRARNYAAEFDSKEANPYDAELDLFLDQAREGDLRGAYGTVDAILRSEQLALPKGSVSYRRLAHAVLMAHISLLKEQSKRVLGGIPAQTVESDSPSVSPMANKKALRLSKLLSQWIAERKPKARTILEWKTCVARFISLNGDQPLPLITKAHIVSFKDLLVSKRLAPATVEKQLNAVKSLLSYAFKNDLVATNVAAGVGVLRSDKNEEKRYPFSSEHLRAIFSHPVFHGEPPTRGKEARWPEMFWLPILGLFTGARVAEIARLRKEDVGTEEGVSYVFINNRDEGKSIKNEASRRKVPLHREIARLGFVKYVASLNKGSQVFPSLDLASLKPEDNFSEWFNDKLLREVGVRGPKTKPVVKGKRTPEKLVFHSFRHTFKDAIRAAGIEEAVGDALQGHTSQSVSRNYGRGYPLRVLKREVDKVRYERLDLSRLTPVLKASG